jgi:hypothetical protein
LPVFEPSVKTGGAEDASGRPALNVAQHIDHLSIRVAGEEAANVPRLEGQRVDNLRARLDRCRVAGVHVIHLNRDIGDDRGGGVVVMRLIWAPGRSGSARVTI